MQPTLMLEALNPHSSRVHTTTLARSPTRSSALANIRVLRSTIACCSTHTGVLTGRVKSGQAGLGWGPGMKGIKP
ncbi:hypothetical protein MA16_Dca011444 [Dendrobium catenatum]|uniref:Uncharacterized protein n=1 Tax=Dendrobium catenatum TaxID=906689 RepID=A0A2I0WK98_9ASPA|nr:hypothetical protein MA16_Dca011444 [Dendrobium catenatum]